QRLKRSNMDLELYLKTRSMTRDELENEARHAAEERIKRTLVLFEIARVEKIKIDQNQLQEETSQAFNEMINYVPPAKRTKESDKQIISGLIEDVSVDILMRNTLEKIRRIAKGEEEALLAVQGNISENPEIDSSEQTLTEADLNIPDYPEIKNTDQIQTEVDTTSTKSDNS
ncbi:MAG: hypothetical protein ACPL0B_02195, partial [Anaerolineales bacterium]